MNAPRSKSTFTPNGANQARNQGNSAQNEKDLHPIVGDPKYLFFPLCLRPGKNRQSRPGYSDGTQAENQGQDPVGVAQCRDGPRAQMCGEKLVHEAGDAHKRLTGQHDPETPPERSPFGATGE